MELHIAQNLADRKQASAAASELRNKLSQNAKTLRESREVNPTADTLQVRKTAAKVLGAAGGSQTSSVKAAASRANGALGGRPRNKPAGL
jgi:hypothetical protein